MGGVALPRPVPVQDFSYTLGIVLGARNVTRSRTDSFEPRLSRADTSTWRVGDVVIQFDYANAREVV
jgi:hypothetical protein